MEKIHRQLETYLQNDSFKGKIIVILGARQVGKSTLIKMLVSNMNQEALWIDGENADVHLLLQNPNSDRLLQMAGNNKIVVIDEAQ